MVVGDRSYQRRTFTGAWIETPGTPARWCGRRRRTFTGAWIETS